MTTVKGVLHAGSASSLSLSLPPPTKKRAGGGLTAAPKHEPTTTHILAANELPHPQLASELGLAVTWNADRISVSS